MWRRFHRRFKRIGAKGGVGVLGFSTGPVGAIGAGTYFTIDAFYPGGIDNYAVDYLSVCAETGC
jgi:hypothetical protein